MGNSTLPYKPKILRDGLTFVLVPVVGATLILLFVYFLWVAAERASTEEQHQSDVVINLNSIFNYWAAADNSLLGLMAEGGERFQFLIGKNTESLRATFDELKALRASEPLKLAELQKLSDSIESDLKIMTGLPRSTDTDSPQLVLVQQMPKVLLQAYKIRGEVRHLLEAQWQSLRLEREKAQKSRQTVHTGIVWAMSLDTVGGITLAILFAGSMAVRIQKLVGNAKHLQRGTPLNTVMSGDDELSYLDKVLHETQSRLEEEAEHRQWIISMVTHDMRSPLLSARANLQIMEEQEDDYPEEAVDELQSCYKLLNGVLKHVDDLLSVKSDTLTASTRLDANSLSTSADSAGKLFLKPGILRQSLALMLIPLAFQLLPAIIINLRLDATQNAIREQQRCGEIVLYSDMILTDMVRGSMAEAAYLLTRASTISALAREAFAQASSDHDHLIEACGENAEWRAYAQNSQLKDREKIDRILNTKIDDLRACARLLVDVGEVNQSSPEEAKTRRMVRTVTQTNLDRLEELNVYRGNQAKTINLVLGLSILINLLFALSLAFIFARSTSFRLRTLMTNASRLGRHQPLETPLTGDDELAGLDAIIHHANARVEDAAKHRSALIAVLAREMQIPLKQTIGHLDGFKAIAGASLREKSHHYLSLASTSIDKVFELVSDLLTIEQMEAGKLDLALTTSCAETLANDAIALVSGLAEEKSIKVENRCLSTELNLDRPRIVRVLVNFLANAIKFAPANSSIMVSSEKQEGAQCVRFSVRDEGAGIDATTSGKVFERYFQAASEHQPLGYGLGLAICKLIVESHGGRLGVDSEPGMGSLFWFEIPDRVQKQAQTGINK